MRAVKKGRKTIRRTRRKNPARARNIRAMPRTKRSRRSLALALVEDRCLQRRAVLARLERLAGVSVLACCERIDDLPAAPPLDALLVADHLFTDRAARQLSEWPQRDRLRILVLTTLSPVGATVLTGLPVDGVLHPQHSDEQWEQLLDGASAPAVSRAFTDRELAVVRSTLAGHSLKTMAAQLGCTVQTIHTYRRRAMRKMNAKNIPDLTLWWNQHGHLHTGPGET